MTHFGSPPRVSLVGAGPGDPGLLTRRGESLLRRADVVLYDGLSNPEILRLAPQAEHICVGKHGQTRIWSQTEINQEMIQQASGGRKVVRLKGGDPAVFARTAEEITALREANLDWEIVPGITAALAASSYAGIPVTHRGLASAVALITGHEEPGKTASALDWQALAKFPGTLVIYMGVTTVQSWTGALLQAGKAADTPAAILRRCSLPDQQAVLCRLDEVAGHLTPATKMRPPVIVIVGPVAQLAETGSWFSQRPLCGQRVLITRAADQADALGESLAELGAETRFQPAITIAPLAAESAAATSLQTSITELSHYDIIAFSSQNGVDYFLAQMRQLGYDSRHFANLKIAAVGARTGEALAAHGLIADFIPADYSAQGLLEMFGSQVSGKRILLPRASRGPDTLPRGLSQLGGNVTEVVCYEHADVSAADPQIVNQLQAGLIDWTTVTSSGIARSLVKLFGESLRHTKLASLSPTTSATLNELGFPATVESPSATMHCLCQTIADYTPTG